MELKKIESQIRDAKSDIFVEQGYELAIKYFGQPAEPLKEKVKIRHTPGRSSLEGQDGIFEIRSALQPSDGTGYWNILGHEVAHLINRKFRDCYVEGLNTVFAEKLFEKLKGQDSFKDLDWLPVKQHFERGKDPFHARTYEMMAEVWRLVDDTGIYPILKYCLPKPDDKLAIDIKTWIDTCLPACIRPQVRQAIQSHLPKVRTAISGVCYCEEP